MIKPTVGRVVLFRQMTSGVFPGSDADGSNTGPVNPGRL